MADLYDSYAADFQALLAGVQDKLAGEATRGKTQERKAVLRRIEMELEEADEIVCPALTPLMLCCRLTYAHANSWHKWRLKAKTWTERSNQRCVRFSLFLLAYCRSPVTHVCV